jgi:hypothetical protein
VISLLLLLLLLHLNHLSPTIQAKIIMRSKQSQALY